MLCLRGQRVNQHKGIFVPPGPTLLGLNSRIVFVGDSITAGSVGPSFTNYSMLAAGGRLYGPPGANQGVGGDDTQRILDRSATWNALGGDLVVVLAGTNDITAGVTETTIEANLSSIYNIVKNNAGKVLALTIMPRNDPTWENGDPTAWEATRQAVNTWIKAQTDIDVLDVETVVDPTTMTMEGLHPNLQGALVLGTAVGQKIATMCVTDSILYTNPSDWGNLLSNNDLAGTAGTASAPASGVVATGWSLLCTDSGVSAVGSKTTVGPYTAQTVTLSGTPTSDGSVLLRNSESYVPHIGDVYDFWMGFKTTGIQNNAGIIMSSDGSTLWLTSPDSNVVSQDVNGVFRNYGQALTSTTDTNSTNQVGVHFDAGLPVSGSFTIWAPTWRKVPAGQ